MEILGSFIVSFLVKFLLGMISDRQAEAAQRQVGRLEVERDQARKGEQVNEDLATEAAKRVSADDAIARLEKGGA